MDTRLVLQDSDVHIDFVRLVQRHASCKVLCQNLALRYDPETGEQTGTQYTWVSVPGRHGSNLQIRSTGSVVQVTGNPSRWNKPEALFGLSWEQSLAVINGVLLQMGLPPFTSERPIVVPIRKGLRSQVERLLCNGARLEEVHITTNLCLGCAEARQQVLAQLPAFKHPELSCFSLKGTVYFGYESRYRTVCWYDKAKELRAKSKDCEPGAAGYRERLAEFCDAEGILRVESRVKRALVSANLRHLFGVSHSALVAELQKEVDFMTERAERSNLDEIPAPLCFIAAAWLQGLDLRSNMTKTTFYRNRKALLAYGIDIAERNNVEQFPVRYRIVDLKAAERPEWYRDADDWAALEGQTDWVAAAADK